MYLVFCFDVKGHSDYPLTEKGITGAQRLGGALRSVSWEYVLCSDLPRTLKTLALVQEQRLQQLVNVQEMITPIIREVNFGIREGLQKDVSVEEARRQLSAKSGVAEDSIIDHGESEDQVRERQKDFLIQLRDVCASLPATEGPIKVLCMTHGGFIRRFLNNFSEVVVDAVPNCSITTIHLTYSADMNSLPKCRPVHVCEGKHLSNSVTKETEAEVEEFTL